MDRELVSNEVNHLVQILLDQEWRGISLKGALYYKKEDLDRMVSDTCPYTSTLVGVRQIVPAIRLMLLLKDVKIGPCRFSHNFKQYSGYRVLLPDPNK